MYNVYLGDMLCPVAPERIVADYSDGCAAVGLAEGGEAYIPHGNSLRNIEFTLLLPNSEYPFAVYKDGFRRADYFLERLEELRRSKKPFQFIIVRKKDGGELLGSTNVKCLMESLRVCDDAAQGYDVSVRITLREYRDRLVKKLDLDSSDSLIRAGRESENSPAPKSKNIKYRVVKGDCMWMIAQRFYGNGNLYLKIYEANRGVLKGRSPRCLIFAGDELEIPPLK